MNPWEPIKIAIIIVVVAFFLILFDRSDTETPRTVESRMDIDKIFLF